MSVYGVNASDHGLDRICIYNAQGHPRGIELNAGAERSAPERVVRYRNTLGIACNVTVSGPEATLCAQPRIPTSALERLQLSVRKTVHRVEREKLALQSRRLVGRDNAVGGDS